MTEKNLKLIIILLLFLTNTSHAQLVTDLVSPQFWKAISECKICNPKQSPYIQQKKAACEFDLKIYECQGLATKYPELKDDIKTCDEKQICEESLFKNSLEAFGCVKGFGENIYDFVSVIGDLAKPSQKNLHEMCLNHPDCAKELLAFEKDYQASLKKIKEQKVISFKDFYTQLNDPELAKLTNIKTALIPQNIYRKYFPEEFQGFKFPSKTEISRFIDEVADKQFRSYDCFNTKARAQLMCYWFFSVVDPYVALKLLKVDKGLGKLIQVAFKDRRIHGAIESEEDLKYFKPFEKKVTRSPQRQAFVDKYLDVQVSTFQERLDFMKIVDAPKSKNRIFIDFENSQLKYLNDSLKDKDFITSVDNYANKLMSDKIQKLALEHKIPLKVYRLSDGKGIALALEAGSDIPPRLSQELSRIANETNKEVQKMLLDSKLIRESDQPEKWFKTGIGQTIDEANLASRFSRGSGENRAFAFSDRTVQENLSSIYQYAKSFSDELGKEPSLSKFMQTIETPNGPTKIPTLEFFENLRKYPNPDQLKAAMRAKYDGLEISENVANKALDYAKIVDDLNPKILVADQSLVTFKSTSTGGMTMDRKGMGAMNQESTAIAIAKSKNFDTFPSINRTEEKIVTEKIEKERKQLKQALDAESRGDDTLKDATYTLQEKRNILKSDEAANRRTVFVPENTPDLATKQQLSTHGEGLEKILTDDILLGKIPYDKQKQIRFGIDMRTSKLGEGQVDLLIQPVNGVTLTPSERKLIQESFNDAVKSFNNKQRSLENPTNYYYRKP